MHARWVLWGQVALLEYFCFISLGDEVGENCLFVCCGHRFEIRQTHLMYLVAHLGPHSPTTSSTTSSEFRLLFELSRTQLQPLFSPQPKQTSQKPSHQTVSSSAFMGTTWHFPPGPDNWKELTGTEPHGSLWGRPPSKLMLFPQSKIVFREGKNFQMGDGKHYKKYIAPKTCLCL